MGQVECAATLVGLNDLGQPAYPMPKPNFFIVGAPKTGSSALYQFLRAHPAIYMPAKKEPHFFGKDLVFSPRYERVADLEKYLALFEKGENCSRIGEASIWYLYSRTAAEEIRAFQPAARIIIMLRNPVEMVYSVYYQSRFDGNEDAPTFEAALDAEAERKLGQRIPQTWLLVDGLFYSDIARYSRMIRRYWDSFGREQVRIILNDDLRDNVEQVYRDTLDFLQVSSDYRPDFRVVNARKEIRFGIVRNFIKSPPWWFRMTRQFARKVVPEDAREQVNQLIIRLNSKPPEQASMLPATRTRLMELYRDEVIELSDLLQRDLSHWISS
jgi:hypothetical protein